MNIPFEKRNGGRPETGRKNDCAVIALSNALNISYFESENFLAANGRKLNRGTYTQTIFGFNLNQHKIILNHKLHLLFKQKLVSHNSKRWNILTYKMVGISLNQFLLKRLPGTYMCNTRKHIFTVKDGVVLSAQREGGRCILTDIWYIEKIN